MAAEYQDAIARCVEAQIELERKAAAWDELRARVALSREPIAPAMLELMDAIVHPAQTPSSC